MGRNGTSGVPLRRPPSSLGSANAGAGVGTAQWIMLSLGLLATAAVITMVSPKARQKLNEVGVKRSLPRATRRYRLVNVRYAC